MDFGMPFLLENSSVEEAARLAAELNLAFVELNMSFPLCQPETLTAGQLRALRDKYGVYFTFHLHEEMDCCGFSGPVRRAWLQVARDSITLAREAGVPAVNLHWPRGVYVTLPQQKDFLFNRYPEAYRQNVLTFRQMCVEASERAVRVCVENTEDAWQPFQQRSIETLLEAPVFGLTLDVGHDKVAGYQDAPFYQTHTSRLCHMHLHDALPRRCHLPLGSGELDIAALVHRARTAGARAVIEIKTVDALRQSVHYLKENRLFYD